MSSYGRKMVMALTGVSRTQLENWERHGIIQPSIKTGTGKATRREYSFLDLVQLKVAKKLRDEGISLQKIRKALTYLRRNFPEVKAPLAELRFLTDGETVFVITKDPKIILDTLREQFVFSFAIGQFIDGLTAEIKRFAKPVTAKVKTRSRQFTITLTPDLEDGGYTVTCKEIPAAISQGETRQEAIDNILDAIELCLDADEEERDQYKTQVV